MVGKSRRPGTRQRLEALPDPRSLRGRIYPLVYLKIEATVPGTCPATYQAQTSNALYKVRYDDCGDVSPG